MTGDDEGRVARWSRRKRAARDTAGEAPVEAPDTAPADATEGAGADFAQDPGSEAELLEKLGLPDPDTLSDGDDFSAFMRRGVPDFLRRRALRRLWASNPVLANLDGLVDYGEDFRDAAMVPEVIASAYQVGRGFVRPLAEEPPETTEVQAEAAPEDATPEAPEDTAAAAVPAPETAAEPAESAAPEESPPEPPLRPRRMRFGAGEAPAGAGKGEIGVARKGSIT